MPTTKIGELADRMVARIEDDDMIFEVDFDEVRVTDVTLEFVRDGTKVGSIYNDFVTSKTMAHLDTPGTGDFIGVEVPKGFVGSLLDAAVAADRVDESNNTVEGYRFRVLDDGDTTEE